MLSILTVPAAIATSAQVAAKTGVEEGVEELHSTKSKTAEAFPLLDAAFMMKLPVAPSTLLKQ